MRPVASFSEPEVKDVLVTDVLVACCALADAVVTDGVGTGVFSSLDSVRTDDSAVEIGGSERGISDPGFASTVSTETGRGDIDEA